MVSRDGNNLKVLATFCLLVKDNHHFRKKKTKALKTRLEANFL